MDEKVLDLIIELAYNWDLSWKKKQLRGELSVELALQVLSVSELYLRAHDGEVNIVGHLVDECAAFALDDDAHCIKVFSIASQFGMADIAAKAKAKIISKLPALANEESAKQQIDSLPKKQLQDLFYSYCAKQ
jgi:ribosomal protein S24E